MSQTIGAVLRQAVSCLARRQVSEPQASAEVLLADVLGMPRTHLYLEASCQLSAEQYTAFRARLHRRLQGEPVQYITGRQEFWSLDFAVNPHVLIPRPESELLVEHGTRLAQQWWATHPQRPLVLLDVGTGSGNLAISLAHTLPQAEVWAVDHSYAALQVAKRNAQRLGVGERLRWVCTDLVTAFHISAPPFALCVANLPYVTASEWRALPREIQGYEPYSALYGGEDGLDLIRRLIATSPGVLAPGGTLLLEVGWQQAAAVQATIQQQGHFGTTGVYYDAAGIARVVWAQVLAE
ncbi:MAG: peptide chain release factor N(5)-glutamine methyltransferase [candidate division KSB1 bacterium]|nr:peptide chain release factor N(5)-glutamine methyltransferase [candidate division KSB1 bacterium]